jgi:hypothetical protein
MTLTPVMLWSPSVSSSAVIAPPSVIVTDISVGESERFGQKGSKDDEGMP